MGPVGSTDPDPVPHPECRGSRSTPSVEPLLHAPLLFCHSPETVSLLRRFLLEGADDPGEAAARVLASGELENCLLWCAVLLCSVVRCSAVPMRKGGQGMPGVL